MSERKKVLSVTLANCRVDEFRSGGPGGQNQNKRNTGIRIVHEPSGAVGESREERSQLQNKKRAFKRMTEHAKFRIWINKVLYNTKDPELEVEKEMDPKNIKVEVREDGQWVEQ